MEIVLSIYKVIIKGGITSLRSEETPITPLNSPPQWDTQPGTVVTFQQGVAASFDMDDYCSDPDADPITHTMNTGTAALPTGVTWTAATGVLSYDGVGAVANTSGHINTISDGTESVDSDAYNIVIADLSWPAYGAHVQGAANVAGLDTQLTDATYSVWQQKKDLIYLQGLYYSSSRVSTTYSGVSSLKSNNSNIKILEYVYPHITSSTPTSGHRYIGWEIVADNSAEDVWRAVDVDSSSYIYDNQGRIFINPAYDTQNGAGGYDNFVDALWTYRDNKAGSGGPQNLEALLDGKFHDSTDYQDNFPKNYESDGTTRAYIDYLKPASSGSQNPEYYRNGIKYLVQEYRTVFGSDKAWSSNGGRDGGAVNEATANNEWAGFWDHRLIEHWEQKIGLVKKAGQNALEFPYSTNQTATLLDDAFRDAKVSLEMVDRTSTNRLGKGLVSLDYVFVEKSPNLETTWEGTDPTSMSDIPQGYFEAMRLVAGMACLDDGFMAAPCFERGVLPCPYLDEFVYDPGDPVGGTPSIGTIDNTDQNMPFTRRAEDDNGFYWQEYDNVLWVVNLNPPTGKSDYPQAATDTCTLPSADTGSGEVWRFADSTYTNGSRTTGATACENQSPLVNDGSLVGSTLTIPRYHARMLVRSAS